MNLLQVKYIVQQLTRRIHNRRELWGIASVLGCSAAIVSVDNCEQQLLLNVEMGLPSA